MQTLKAIQSFPVGTPVDSIQVKIEKAFERKSVNTDSGTIQNAIAVDGTGERIKLAVWGHPDLSRIVGNEVVIQAGKNGKGLTVKRDTYKGANELYLDVGKSCTFQNVAVSTARPADHDASATGATQSREDRYASSDEKKMRGQRVGMAINNAIVVLGPLAVDLARDGKLAAAVTNIASQIIEASIALEGGEKRTEAVRHAPAPAPAPAPAAAAAPAPAQEVAEEDVPF